MLQEMRTGEEHEMKEREMKKERKPRMEQLGNRNRMHKGNSHERKGSKRDKSDEDNRPSA